MELGIKTPIAWAGPEIYLPPLMGPDQFDAFITKYDNLMFGLALDKENQEQAVVTIYRT